MARKKRLSIIDYFNAEAPFASEFRRLLQRLRNRQDGGELKSILITSAMLSEGKSTISSFLAITAAAHKGLKTLLIDCDLRRPNIHNHYLVPRDLGITEILVEGFNPRDAVKKTEIDKLDLLTAGRACESPSAVFDVEAIGTLIDEMKFYYDLIVVDSPPLIPVSDPMLLAPKLDGVLLVVKVGQTQREVVERATQIIKSSSNRVLGVILNNVNNALPFYFDQSYYGYEYNQTTPKISSPSDSAAGKRTGDGKKKDNFEKKL